MRSLNVLSLFDGISCARVALDRVGIKVKRYWASEIDKYAIQIAQKNYPDTSQLNDVTSFYAPEFEGMVDLLIGGSPCQDLSIAKKNRKGLDGERSGLFWEYVRILKEAKPKYFILENVNSMPSSAKDIITKTLGVEPIMINAALVSAQNRKRLFWTNIPNVKLPEDRGIMLKDILESGNVDRLKSYCIDASYFKGANWDQYIKKGRRQLVIDKNGKEKEKSNTVRSSGRGSGVDDKHNWDTIRVGIFNKGGQGDRIYSPDGKSTTLSAHGGGRGAKTKQRIEIGGDKANTITKVQKDSMVLVDTRQMSREGIPRIYDKGKSPTLNSTMYKEPYSITNGCYIRKLTPIECERLQGLPDDYTSGISNSQRYKCLGNAFNVDVIAHILSFIK